MIPLRRILATSDHPFVRRLRRLRSAVVDLSVPAPRAVVVPARVAHDVLRECWWYGVQHLLCEPYFKSHCKQYGENLHTGCYFHYVTGSGDILVGDDVTIDGRVTITFAARYSDHPTLEIGSRITMGHDCRLSIAKKISIGSDSYISPNVFLFDSPGHPSDPADRRKKMPPAEESIKPIVVSENVWIGTRSIVAPGVTIGEGSVIAAGSMVMSNVDPNCVMAGNPARKIAVLKPETGKPG